MTFSATDAALEGFRIARERPMAMVIWALASLVISLVSSVGAVSMFGGTLNQLTEMSGTGSSDPEQALAMMGQLGLLYLFILPIALLIFSVFTTAVYRAVLRPSDSAFAYLRLGAAELRIAVVLVVLFLLGLVVLIGILILFALVAALLGGVLAMGDGGGMGAMGVFAVVVLLGYIGMFFVSLAFWTKFSLAGPMTFAEGRIRIFGSWGATKGRFWALFGSYLLAGILGIIVSLLGGAISLAIMVAFGGASAGGADFTALLEAMQADYSSLAVFFTPAMLANMVVSALFSALTYAIILAPPAVAYREIVARSSPAVADSFS